MAGERPLRRGSRVVYREDIADDTNDSDYLPGEHVNDVVYGNKTKVQSWPPLTDIQRELRQVCRLGDRVLLKQFLTDKPGLDLDVKCPDGTTVLNEAVTKTAQFSGIVEVLLDFGARLDVCDSLGNTPLHNSVLYHPSTQDTVDLLLMRGADPTAKNFEDQTPVAMADDKDLKEVLKELKRGGKKRLKDNNRELIYSPDLRRRVTLSGALERLRADMLLVRFNNRPPPKSPGLLKKRLDIGDHEEESRKRKRCDDDEEHEDDEGEEIRERKRKRSNEEFNRRRGKRIRWCEVDSTGAPIDPQFSEEEGVINKDEKILECRIEDQQSGTESRIPEGGVDDHIRIGEGDGQAECRIPKEEGDIRIGEEGDVQGRLHRIPEEGLGDIRIGQEEGAAECWRPDGGGGEDRVLEDSGSEVRTEVEEEEENGGVYSREVEGEYSIGVEGVECRVEMLEGETGGLEVEEEEDRGAWGKEDQVEPCSEDIMDMVEHQVEPLESCLQENSSLQESFPQDDARSHSERAEEVPDKESLGDHGYYTHSGLHEDSGTHIESQERSKSPKYCLEEEKEEFNEDEEESRVIIPEEEIKINIKDDSSDGSEPYQIVSAEEAIDCLKRTGDEAINSRISEEDSITVDKKNDCLPEADLTSEEVETEFIDCTEEEVKTNSNNFVIEKDPRSVSCSEEVKQESIVCASRIESEVVDDSTEELVETKSIAVNDSIEEESCDEKIEGRMKCFHKHARGSLEENGDKKVIIENVSCEGIYDHIIQSKRESTMGKSDSLDKINTIKESCENIIKLKTDSFSDPIGNTEEIIHSQSSQEAISVKEQFIVDDAIEDEMSDEKVEGEKSDDTIGISDVETAPDSEDAAEQEDTKTDTNENFTPAHKEPLRIHMKANGDDNDLDSDLSQEEPKVIEISGGFGFFVN